MSETPLVRRTFENVAAHNLNRIVAAASVFGFGQIIMNHVGTEEESVLGSTNNVEKYDVTVYMKEEDFGKLPPDDGPPYVKLIDR